VKTLRNDRGAALVEVPFAVCAVLVLACGALTISQMLWAHLGLASGVRDATRYASRAAYGGPDADDPAAHRRTAADVQRWLAVVADEAGVEPGDVTVRVYPDRDAPFGEPDDDAAIPLESARSGDIVIVEVTKRVSNPLYRLGAQLTNAAGSIFPAVDGQTLNPDGVTIEASAETFVE
jgi:hypothetical protein